MNFKSQELWAGFSHGILLYSLISVLKKSSVLVLRFVDLISYVRFICFVMNWSFAQCGLIQKKFMA